MLLLCSLNSTAFSQENIQEKFTLNGYLKDGKTGETLIGASVFVQELGTGTTSNEYGFYSISIPAGTYTVEFRYVGFSPKTEPINLIQNIKLDIEMGENSANLAEVIVSSKAADRNVSDLQMSVNKLDAATIKKIPSLLGEVEIIRSLQLLPGVSTVGEGATGFNVRGGSIDQNLVLLDEAPVYNSSHLFGFFSVFNPDAVKDVQLYKGGIPSRFGGRLSSILDVRMKEGNNKQLGVSGGVGTIFSRLAVEAPIIKDKASFIVAARRSYIDVLASPFLSGDLENSVLNFYDLTAKANYNINDKNRVFLSGYLGRDNFGFGNAAGFNWGNGTATARWNHLFNEKLFSNFTLFYSNYDYQIKFGEDSDNNFNWDAKIINYSAKPEFAYYISPNNILRFGGQGIIYEFEPGNATGGSEGEVVDFGLAKQYAIESAVYVENELKLGGFEINYGLRLSHFNYTGAGKAYEYGAAPAGTRRPLIGTTEYDQWESIQTYANLEPRLALKYQIDESKSLKASYMRTAQYIHLISNTTASTPVDVWTPSTNNIKPQRADQFAIGYFQNLKDNAYEFSAEVYYKGLDNLLDYIVSPGPELLLNELLEGDILAGDGRAYGLELMFKKNKGRFTGWASYTLARTELQVDGINNQEWYPSRFDQTHNLSLTAFYQTSKRWSFSANFAYITGTPVTFANAGYYQQGYFVPHNSEQTRNNSRIPNYHRMDISATLEGKKNEERRWQGRWVFSVYNVYNRRNAFSVFQRQENNRTQVSMPVSTAAYQLSVIGSLIPAVAYNFEF
ncbi:MAG: carboxypeptidase-like regulatory domain-containing protein [Saprospiraceae bacterium]